MQTRGELAAAEAHTSAERGRLFATELLTWDKTPMVDAQCVKGPDGGVDCKMLMAGAARACGFPEGSSIYAMMSHYRLSKPVDCTTLWEGLNKLFDPVPFVGGQKVPEELQLGDIMLLKMNGRLQHLAGVTRTGLDGRAMHVQFGNKNWAKETRLAALIRKYPLKAIFRWRDL